MTDVCPSLNALITENKCKPIEPVDYAFDRINEFLKEAYQINSRIAELITFLRSIRRSYLSTAPPPRQSRFANTPKHSRKTSRDSQHNETQQYLTNAQRDQIDTEAKATWRDINAAITRLAQAEKVRQQTEDALVKQRRRKKGLGALGSWAAGGAPTEKTAEEEEEDGRMKSVAGCREGVIWFLQRGLEECGKVQGHMMEVRITREVERGKSTLREARGGGAGVPPVAEIYGPKQEMNGRPPAPSVSTTEIEEHERSAGFARELSPEQMQLFAEENRDLLKHYEDRLDQVRTAEKSLIEISELQSTLASNLETQSAHIESLVQDSFSTAEDVKGGNKELKKASERKSTAKMVFYSTLGLCSFLVIWDLII